LYSPLGTKKIARHRLDGKAFWQPPPHGFLKLNIDGASKGNPRDAGYEVIRDAEGNIKVIFTVIWRGPPTIWQNSWPLSKA